MSKFNSSCDYFERLIFESDELVDGGISGELRTELEKHVLDCDSCRKLQMEERQLTMMLAGHSTKSRADRSLPSGLSHSESNDEVASRLWPFVTAIAAVVLIGTSFWYVKSQLNNGSGKPTMGVAGLNNQYPDSRQFLGSIVAKHAITDVSFRPTTESLKPANHLELPAGAAATVELRDMGTINAIGPAVLGIDRIDSQWKITLLTGNAKISVTSDHSIQLAGRDGIAWLDNGIHIVNSECAPRSTKVEQQDSNDEQKKKDDELSLAELIERGHRVFQADGESGPDQMKVAAEMLSKVLKHPEASSAQKYSAGFYRIAALANSKQHKAVLAAAEDWQKQFGDGGSAMIPFIVAETNWKLGNKDKARTQFEALLKKYPDSPYKPMIQNYLGKIPEEKSSSKTENSKTEKKSSSVKSKQTDSKIKVLWSKELDAPSFGGAAVADADKDGRLEVAFGTYFGDDSVRVLNGEDGSQLWRYDAGQACLDASLRFFDLDSDGNLELLVPISNKGELIAFEPDTGKEIWSYKPDPTECTDSPSTILDVDGDGKFEFVYGTFLGNLHVVSAETGIAKRVYKICEEFIQTAPTVIDLNDDGIMDFVCATFKGKNNVYATDGKTGDILWKYHVPGDHMGMYHGCSIGDLDGDENIELVIAAYDGKVHCLNAVDGTLKWATKTEDRYIMSPTVIADLDGDGKSEVISTSENVTVIDCNGKILWSQPCAAENTWDSATRGASIADLDGDGRLDIATLNGRGDFQVRSGKGELLYQFAASEFADFTPQSSSHGVTIADFDGDEKLDVFFVVGTTQTKPKKGLAICLTGFEGGGSGWYMLRHDPQSTGNVATKIAPALLRHIETLKAK